LLDPACLARVSEFVCVESFCRHEHRSTCEALSWMALPETGCSFDTVLISDELVRVNRFKGLAVSVKLTFCPAWARFENHSPVPAWMCPKESYKLT
jgi:replicative DNA helicase